MLMFQSHCLEFLFTKSPRTGDGLTSHLGHFLCSSWNCSERQFVIVVALYVS